MSHMIETAFAEMHRSGASEWVPAAPVTLVAEFHEAMFDGDPSTATPRLRAAASRLASRCTPEQVIHVSCRLIALHNLVLDNEVPGWVLSRGRNGLRLRDPIAFHHATARASLRSADHIVWHRFEADAFLAIALEEARPEGYA